MKIFNFGSLNIDHVYRVPHLVKPGETLASHDYQMFVGGKGLNQSIALARAGADVCHVGCIGKDGDVLRQVLEKNGVNTSLIERVDGPSGHAIIEVDSKGENSILLYGGANMKNNADSISKVFEHISEGEFVLMQNEINGIPQIIEQGNKLKCQIIFNPAPMSTEVMNYPLQKVDCFILNQSEAEAMTGYNEPNEMLRQLQKQFPHGKIVLTLGSRGAIYKDAKQQISIDAVLTEAFDTTGAGDTFIGYFLAEMCQKESIYRALKIASKAASHCIQRAGAADSIPFRNELIPIHG